MSKYAPLGATVWLLFSVSTSAIAAEIRVFKAEAADRNSN